MINVKFYESGKVPPTPHMYFIYGDGGTGKTSLFKGFEGKKLLFSFDLSTNVLIGDESIDVFKLEERDMPVMQQELGDLLNRAIGSGRYQAICLDNVTALQNIVLENIDGASKDNRQNYQKLQLWFRQLGTYLRDCGLTVYATAHQIDNGPDKMQGRFSADMNEKTFNAFTSMFDLVGRIYIKDGERLIDLDPEQGNHAKNSKSGNPMIEFNYEVLDGQYAGAPIRYDYAVWNDDEDHFDLSVRRFNTIMIASGIPSGKAVENLPQVASVMNGRKLAVSVDWEESQNGNWYLRVKSYHKLLQEGSQPNGKTRPESSQNSRQSNFGGNRSQARQQAPQTQNNGFNQTNFNVAMPTNGQPQRPQQPRQPNADELPF